MSQVINADLIINLHENCILHWKKKGIHLSHQEFYQLVEENHCFNYQLWHAEDKARREDKGFEFVYHAKREIDHFNQQRNNRMEMMDGWLFQQLAPASYEQCPVHSETPGMMIDRLSILALKAFHMAIQVEREDVDTTHRERCKEKLAIIVQQQQQLGQCLDELLAEVVAKTRTFRVYHQFKMYNDPQLNPELYSKV
ncbi:DUF4254 domain-containing protein [Legionella israelensis]|uniref:DUF4254 domain-containing protein n=1 Tax=Legionella israelensis TaxID=454 RepID=UPI00117BF28C|nr:DUF4254 domain-containing protein [Legionella israelensis]QDP71594.1 DUF4254 domain-containing protein [Legionella israelensis]